MKKSNKFSPEARERAVRMVQKHRDSHGVEPICKVLQITPSGYRRYAAQQHDATRLGQRAKSDSELTVQIKRIWQTNLQLYGADKVWKQLIREGTVVARCTVERLMRGLGLRGVARGKVVRTTSAPQDCLPAGPGQPAVPGGSTK